jgi:2-polyprenyl-3-methyl-5-hydroxy-6-metoxy-1,4-benzoquinol methylase
MQHWTKNFFINKGALWLQFLNLKWKHGARDAKAITKILKKYGIRKGVILELCCGNGRISINLAKMGFLVTGIDISSLCVNDAIKRAKKRKIKNAQFICGDMRTLNTAIRRKYDAVISIWTSIGFYSKQTDKRIFHSISKLLKKKGVVMILSTMSREFLLQHFCPTAHEEIGNLLVMHKHHFDTFHSIINNKWIFYKKSDRNLTYIDEIDFSFRIYSMHEMVEMAESAGLEFVEAYDSLRTLRPIKSDSHINMIFKKL